MQPAAGGIEYHLEDLVTGRHRPVRSDAHLGEGRAILIGVEAATLLHLRYDLHRPGSVRQRFAMPQRHDMCVHLVVVSEVMTDLMLDRGRDLLHTTEADRSGDIDQRDLYRRIAGHQVADTLSGRIARGSIRPFVDRRIQRFSASRGELRQVVRLGDLKRGTEARPRSRLAPALAQGMPQYQQRQNRRGLILYRRSQAAGTLGQFCRRSDVARCQRGFGERCKAEGQLIAEAHPLRIGDGLPQPCHASSHLARARLDQPQMAGGDDRHQQCVGRSAPGECAIKPDGCLFQSPGEFVHFASGNAGEYPVEWRSVALRNCQHIEEVLLGLRQVADGCAAARRIGNRGDIDAPVQAVARLHRMSGEELVRGAQWRIGGDEVVAQPK